MHLPRNQNSEYVLIPPTLNQRPQMNALLFIFFMSFSPYRFNGLDQGNICTREGDVKVCAIVSHSAGGV